MKKEIHHDQVGSNLGRQRRFNIYQSIPHHLNEGQKKSYGNLGGIRQGLYKKIQHNS